MRRCRQLTLRSEAISFWLLRGSVLRAVGVLAMTKTRMALAPAHRLTSRRHELSKSLRGPATSPNLRQSWIGTLQAAVKIPYRETHKDHDIKELSATETGIEIEWIPKTWDSS
jgi:hypothetical protein